MSIFFLSLSLFLFPFSLNLHSRAMCARAPLASPRAAQSSTPSTASPTRTQFATNTTVAAAIATTTAITIQLSNERVSQASGERSLRCRRWLLSFYATIKESIDTQRLTDNMFFCQPAADAFLIRLHDIFCERTSARARPRNECVL